jgi:hypothetical protein
MTRTKSTFLALVAVLLSPLAANADLLTFDITYDGTVFTGDSLSGVTLDAGDVIEITLSAELGDYWMWLANDDWIANLLNADGINTGTTDWEFFFDGSSTGAGGGNSQTQQFAHIGPQGSNGLNLSPGTLFDQFFFGYTYESGPLITLLDANFLNPNGWLGSPWDWTFNDGITATYVDNPTSVPEPGTLALLGIGLLGMAASRRRKKV